MTTAKARLTKVPYRDRTTLTAAEAGNRLRAVVLAFERQQIRRSGSPGGDENRTCGGAESASDQCQSAGPDVFTAIATGIETQLVSATLTPGWFTSATAHWPTSAEPFNACRLFCGALTGRPPTSARQW